MNIPNDSESIEMKNENSPESPPPIPKISTKKNMMDHVSNVYKKSFKLEGRASRSEYWFFQLFYTLILVISGIVFYQNIYKDWIDILLILLVIFTICSAPAQISLCVRRWHDLNRSGAWFFIQLIPYIGFLIMIVFFLFKGSIGENDYGQSE